jgi:hypothetical protein
VIEREREEGRPRETTPQELKKENWGFTAWFQELLNLGV